MQFELISEMSYNDKIWGEGGGMMKIIQNKRKGSDEMNSDFSFIKHSNSALDLLLRRFKVNLTVWNDAKIPSL